MSDMQDALARAAVRLLEAAAGDDAAFVDGLAGLVNDVYATAEAGLWRDGARRTTALELSELIRAGQIAVATRRGRIVGCVRVFDVAGGTGELGMLVAAPDERGSGIGSALVAFAEEHSCERGCSAIRLELLVPREWRHPGKERLRTWYGRLGYRLVRTAGVEERYPHLVPLLATPCDIEGYEKPLR